MTGYQLTLLIKDVSLRQALSRSLEGDGRLSLKDVKALLKSTLDGDGVSPQEFKDLQTILSKAKTIDIQSKNLIDEFMKKHYRPIISQKPNPSGQLTKNFNVSEFACKDGTVVPAKLLENVTSLAKNLQQLRDKVGKAIKINSAYRTVTHNKAIGGEVNSQHLLGKAADIVISGMTPSSVKKQIEELIKDKKMVEGGIGLYNSFVHYDIRGTKARW